MRVCSTFFQFQPSGELEEEMENPEMVNLPEKQKHQLRHRELFLSRQLESLPATHIRYAYILCLKVLFPPYLHFKVLPPSLKVSVALVLDLLIGKQLVNFHQLLVDISQLFFAVRQPKIETLSASLWVQDWLIMVFSCRGKCCVTLLNETEALKSYLDREVGEMIPHCGIWCVFRII